MIRQITEFRAGDGDEPGTLEFFCMSQTDEDMAKHDELVKQLAKDAIIEYVDGDTVRGAFKTATQEKLLELLEYGWSFSE